MDEPTTPGPQKKIVKKLKPHVQEVLKLELQEKAFNSCRSHLDLFAHCSRKEGFMSLFLCKSQMHDCKFSIILFAILKLFSSLVSDCLDQHFNDVKFREYCNERGYGNPRKKTPLDNFIPRI